MTPQTPDDLRRQFGDVPGLTFDEGRGGMTACRVRTDAAEADVYLHGAHVTHFKPVGGRDVLFLSEKAVFDGAKAIRGGVPVCFPWFADAGEPAHGFARTMPWSLADARADGEDVVLRFVLVSTEATRELWPGEFVFDFTVTVGRELSMAARVTNVGDEAFEYELALHTYLAVEDVREARVEGFAGGRYTSKVEGKADVAQEGEPSIEGEVDRVYHGHTADVTVVDADRRITVAKSGGRSTVLWNPHVEKAKRMADFGDGEWPRMLCVESAAIRPDAVRLAAGAKHALTARVSVA